MLERINKEIRRHSRIVSLFPSQASCIRLIGTYLMEYAEDWEIKKCYIRPDKLQKVMEIYEARLNAACEHFLTLSPSLLTISYCIRLKENR